MFLDRVIHFGETLGDQVKGRSPKNVKSLIEVPNLVHVKVQVLRLSMLLTSTPYRVLTPSYPFRRKFGRLGKGSFSEKAKNFNRGSLSVSGERTCFLLPYYPSLISVVCSKTELSVSEKILEIK